MDEALTEKKPDEPQGPNWGLYFAAGVFLLVCAGLIYLAIPSADEPQGPPVEMYGPWRFEWEPPFWKTLYQRDGQVFDIRFRYLPQDVENITINEGAARLVSPFYLSFDPNMSSESLSYVNVAFTDSTLKLRGLYNELPRAACTRNDTDPACANVPTVTCDTPNASAIIFIEAPEPSLTLNGSCIIIRGEGEDLYRTESLMWYRLLGIVR